MTCRPVSSTQITDTCPGVWPGVSTATMRRSSLSGRLRANAPKGPPSSTNGSGANPGGSGWRKTRRITRAIGDLRTRSSVSLIRTRPRTCTSPSMWSPWAWVITTSETSSTLRPAAAIAAGSSCARVTSGRANGTFRAAGVSPVSTSLRTPSCSIAQPVAAPSHPPVASPAARRGHLSARAKRLRTPSQKDPAFSSVLHPRSRGYVAGVAATVQDFCSQPAGDRSSISGRVARTATREKSARHLARLLSPHL